MRGRGHPLERRLVEKLRRCARCTACGHKGATIQHPGWGGEHIGFLPFPVARQVPCVGCALPAISVGMLAKGHLSADPCLLTTPIRLRPFLEAADVDRGT
jgi:hypothetical protein